MLKKRLDSFGFAFRGISLLFRSQINARIHLLATLTVSAAGWYFQLSGLEWCVIALCVATVLVAEAFNTALESLTDLVSPGYHTLAGKAKDLAAGAVLLAAMGAAIAGAIIFLPKLLACLNK